MIEREGYWRLVDPYWKIVSIHDGGEAFLQKFQKLPLVSQNLYAAHWTQSEVRNDGFMQFCSNPTGVLAPEAMMGFNAIGMPKAANIVGEFLAYWGDKYPRDQEEREEVWQALVEKEGYEPGFINGFGYLDEPFFDLLKHENGGFKVRADAYAMSGEN